MQHYYKPNKKFMSRKDVLALLTRDSRALIPEKIALYCFGMSKMTVINEMQ